MSQERITVRAMVKAPRQKVWDCYTQPHHITRWNFADESWQCPHATNDVRVGGTYNARMEARDGSMGFDFVAIYTEVSEGHQFSYEFGNRQATVTFEESAEGTEVVISFEPETEHSLELQQAGWQSILNRFQSYAEVGS
jgi:uncharacterized protein YndB with AHSA1/START domain